MNNTKIDIYKKALQEVFEKFNAAKALVRERIESYVAKKNISKRGNLFVYERL